MGSDASPRPSKMAIVLTEDSADKLLPFATLASGAVALGMEVHVFASYWGLVAFRVRPTASETHVAPGHGEEGARLEQALKAKNAPSWRRILEMAKSLGELHIYACSQSVDLLGLKKEDLDPLVESVTGVATFVDRTRDASVTYFI